MPSLTVNSNSLTKVADGVYYMKSQPQLIEGNIGELDKKNIKCYIAACKEAEVSQSIKELLNGKGIKTMTLSPEKTSALQNKYIFETESDMANIQEAIKLGNIVIGYNDADRRPILALLGVSMMKTRCSFLEALAKCIHACPLEDMEKDFRFCHEELIEVFRFKQKNEDEDKYRCLLDVDSDGPGGPNFTAHLIVSDEIKEAHGNYANLLKHLKNICEVA